MRLRQLPGVKLIVIAFTSSSASNNVVSCIGLVNDDESFIRFAGISGVYSAWSSSQEVESFSRITKIYVLVVAISLGPNFLEERTPDATICRLPLIHKLHVFTFPLGWEVIVNGYHGGFTSNEDSEGVDTLLRVGLDFREEDILNSFVSFSDGRAGRQEVAITKIPLFDAIRIHIFSEGRSFRDNISGSLPLEIVFSLIRMDASVVVREVWVFEGLVSFQHSL